MRRLKKKLILLLVVVMTLTQGMMVNADNSSCSPSHVGQCYLYSKTLRYRQKTGEHVITLNNGTQATCYIYTESYDTEYYCQNCHSTFRGANLTVENVHSLGR